VKFPTRSGARQGADHTPSGTVRVVRAAGDWDVGAYKAACPDGMRLTGLGHSGARGLCTDAATGDLRAAGSAQTVVTDERHVPAGGDWASRYTKARTHCCAGKQPDQDSENEDESERDKRRQPERRRPEHRPYEVDHTPII
jgi:hypothetical protein